MPLQRSHVWLRRAWPVLLALGSALPAGAQANPRQLAPVLNAAGQSAAPEAATGVAALADDRVMLQAFYWESYRHGLQPGYGQRRWYEIVRDRAPAIAAAGFDLIWLPPPPSPVSAAPATTPSSTSTSATATAMPCSSGPCWWRCCRPVWSRWPTS